MTDSGSILVLSPFFSPEPISTGKYNTFFVKGLAQGGERILVCCSYPLYPDWVPRKTEQGLDNIKIFRGGLKVLYPKSVMLRRLTLECWFAFHVLAIFLKTRSDVGKVVTIFPPSLFFYLLRFVLPKRITCIGIVHDLQGLLGLSDGGIIKKIFAAIVKHVEVCGFRACDRLILLSRGMMQRVVKEYGIAPEKCSVHYPFVSEVNRFSNGKKLQKLFPEGFCHVVYSGAMGNKQDPFNLLAVYQEVVKVRQNVMCHIFSRGPLMEEVKKSCLFELRDRIQFHDLVDEEDLPELFARSSVQVIPQKKGTSDGAFPSKLPNLLAAGVPVFAVTDEGSELEILLTASGIGCCCNSWNHELLLPTLYNFLDSVGIETHTVRSARIRPFVNKYFELSNLIEEIQKTGKSGIETSLKSSRV